MEIVQVVTSHGRRAAVLPAVAARLPAAAVGHLAGAVARIDRVLRSVELLAAGVISLENEVRGMRGDVQEVTKRVDLLRGEFAHLADEVKDIGVTTAKMSDDVAPLGTVVTSLEERLGDMSSSLREIDRIAMLLTRRGRRELRDRAA
jgi:hypothetical protein